MMMIYFSLLILFSYIFLILSYWYFWIKTDVPAISSKSKNLPNISIIIIGRNEAGNIKKCLTSIAANKYPISLYEIIYIDDFSTDKSLEVLHSLEIDNLSIYELKEFIGDERINNYKKVAIKYAISKAKGDVILQTDADTIVDINWIESHAVNYIDSDINLVTAPVLYKSDNTALQQFQKFDILTTMGVTAAGITSGIHYMANGANMSYRKSVYQELNRDSKYASGDDMFLVQNIAEKYRGSIVFLKSNDAVVYTNPEKTIKDFFKQRLRWASKTGSYKNLGMKLMVLLVFMTNFVILTNVLLIFFLGRNQLYFTLLIIVLKLIFDYIFIVSIAKYFKEKIIPFSLIASLLRYPIYIVSIGLISLFVKKYTWKGRKVK